MNVIETPKQSEHVLKYINESNYWDAPLVKNYPGYEVCFVAFHPFLQCPSQEYAMNMHQDYRPNKKDIHKNCTPLSWKTFQALSGIADYTALDRALAQFHGSHDHCHKEDYRKLLVTLRDHPTIRVAEVDWVPEVWEDPLLGFLLEQGYTHIHIYSDTDPKVAPVPIPQQLDNPQRLLFHVRIETPDGQFLLADDFDQRSSYFFGRKTFIEDLVKTLDLEGFYADALTTGGWSFIPVDEEDRWTDHELERTLREGLNNEDWTIYWEVE